jgi:hypothetical protein
MDKVCSTQSPFDAACLVARLTRGCFQPQYDRTLTLAAQEQSDSLRFGPGRLKCDGHSVESSGARFYDLVAPLLRDFCSPFPSPTGD